MTALGYLVPEFPSQTHAFFWREIQALRSLGADVTLLSTTRPSTDACRHEFAATAAAETTYLFPAGLRSVGSLLRRPGRTLAAIRYISGLKETRWYRRVLLLGLIPSAARLTGVARQKGFTHVHIHSCANAAHLGALARILADVSYSLTLHGDLPVYGTDHASKMRDAAFVACVTRPLRDQVMQATGLPLERVPVLWMGVDIARFRDDGSRVSEPGALTAVTVARLSFPKGHRFALRALKSIKEKGVRIAYLIAGEGAYKDGIVAEVEALGLAADVQFLGNVSEDDVAALLAKSDVLLLPSMGMGEAAPVAVMEAMASGLPVVASVIGGTPDMIDNEVDGFLCSQEDVEAITSCLRRLADDVALRKTIGAAGRKRAERDFDSRVLAARLLHLVTGRAASQVLRK
jgi:colanic acid/amylovoran biosynthesis glycosyltransferase